MWYTLECAVQGRGHIKNEIPCQDKTHVVVDKNNIAIALADGAGSAKYSHFGAERISSQICEHLLSNFLLYYEEQNGVEFKKKIITFINTTIAELALELKCDVKDLASTLLSVVISDDKYIIIHIGDGVIGYLKDSVLKVASAPENGEFVNTTVFTTSSDAIVSMKAIKGNLNSIEGFVLMSDGTEASMYNKQEYKLAPGIKRIMHLCQTTDVTKIQEQLTQSFESTIKMATTDDCSIVIITKSNGFAGYNSLNESQKAELLGFEKYTIRQLNKYNDIIRYAQTPISLNELSKLMHLKPKYIKTAIDKLITSGYLYENNGKYQTTLLLEEP